MNAIVISTIEGLHKYYDMLKEDAKIHDSPNIYHIGFDIEYITRDAFSESFHSVRGQNKVRVAICTMQLSSKNVCLIVRVSEFPFLPRCLSDIITSQNWIKSGVGIDLDLMYCYENFDLSGVSNYIDLKTYGFLMGFERPNLENLVSEYLGKDFKKCSISVRDWTESFSERDILYLVEDAYYSYVLGIRHLPIHGSEQNPNEKVFRLRKVSVTIDETEENYISRISELCQKHGIAYPICKFTNYDGHFYTEKCSFSGKMYYTDDSFDSKKEAKQSICKMMLHDFCC